MKRQGRSRAAAGILGVALLMGSSTCSISVNTDPPERRPDERYDPPTGYPDSPPGPEPVEPEPAPIVHPLFQEPAYCSGGSSGGVGNGGAAGAGGVEMSGGFGGEPNDESPSAAPATYWTGPCPSAPYAGGQCSPHGETCEYGSVTAIDCRQLWICDSGTWRRVRDGCFDGCGDAPAEAEGASQCSYRTGEDCSLSGGLFTCSTRANPPGCPSTLPFHGSDCSRTPDGDCRYGHCGGSRHVTARCCGGTWYHSDPACGL